MALRHLAKQRHRFFRSGWALVNAPIVILVLMLCWVPAHALAGTVFKDDFTDNPSGLLSSWVATTPDGSYPILWTGAQTPNSWSAALPANASGGNLYSFSDGLHTLSTASTANPAAGWTSQTYSVDFIMGGDATTLGDLGLGVLVNRSGTNGYRSSFSLGGDGKISWTGCYGWSGYDGPSLAKDVWYRLVTVVTRTDIAISVQARIERISDGAVLRSSPVYTDGTGQYADPNGFALEVGNGIGYYWNRAMQLDNFQVDAVVSEVVFVDDFGINPLLSPKPRWEATTDPLNYPIGWTGDTNWNSSRSSLPANVNGHSLYAFSEGTSTFSTVSTANPSAGWTKQTYQVDFICGGDATTLSGMSLGMVANRSGTNGYRSSFLLSSTSRVRWTGVYGSFNSSANPALAKNIWYRLVTDVARSGTSITVQARIVRISDGAVLHTSPLYTDTTRQYADPNGYRLEVGSGTGYYWDRAMQLDNFRVTADVAPPAWRNNSLGKDQSVPAPWTPVTVSGNTVSVWGRSYHFNNIGLPVAMVSQGQDLFGGTPMTANVRVNGQTLTFSASGGLQVDASRSDQVVVKGAATSNVSGVTLQVISTIEFDGFVRSRVTLAGNSGHTLNQFWLDTSLASAHASYALPQMGNPAAIPPQGLKRPLHGPWDFVNFTPPPQMYWVGGDDIGLFLSAEDDRTWQSANRDEAQELIPQTGRTIWRYHVVDSDRSLATPQELDFCYMATPVKPVADWYAHRVAGDASYDMGNTVTEPYQPYTGTGNCVDNGAALGIKQMSFHEQWTKTMGYPNVTNAADDASLSWLADAFQDKGINLCLYSHPVLSDAAPEFNRWGSSWSARWPAQYGDFTRDPSFSGVDPQSVFFISPASEWPDFYIWNWQRLQQNYGVSGVYLDGTFGPAWDSNPNRSNAYLVDGVCRPTYTIYAAREFMKRWYKTMKGNNPNFFFLAHASDAFTMPSASFLDYGMGGEEFWQREGRELDWSLLRAAYTGRQFGMRRDLYATGVFQEPYLVPLAMVHGIGIFGRGAGSITSTYARSIWDAWDSFGVSAADCEWVPYWKGSSAVTSDHAEVKVSYYKRPGTIMLSAATNKRVRPTASVSIDLPALGIDPNHFSIKRYGKTRIYSAPVNGVLTLSFLDQLANTGGNAEYVVIANTPPPVTVYSDNFASNPFASRWSKTNTGGNYELLWTGSTNPNSWSAGLPVNANAHSVYSFSGGPRTMSTTNTSVPAGLTGWTEMTYSLDFQMGGTGGNDNNYIEVLVNRSGDNGYKAAIYTGGGGHIAWAGDYPFTFTSPNVNVADSTWYKFETTVIKVGADIIMQSHILNMNGNILATSPVKTFTNAAYTDPNGFKISLSNGGGYWDHASQIDNFSVGAVTEGFSAWAATNAGSQAANLDYDNDGVLNGIEYFMNAAPGFTANPAFVGNTVNWTNGGNIPSSQYGTQFVVQISSNLVDWEDVPKENLSSNTDGPLGSLSYTAAGTGKQFVRLKVMAN